MFNLSVYEAIEIINAIPEILIIALFYHRIFERKYNSYLPYIISYGIAFVVLSVTSLLVASPYVRIGITFAILLTFAIFLYSGSNTVVSSDVLVKICSALGCTMDDIVEIIPEKEDN